MAKKDGAPKAAPKTRRTVGRSIAKLNEREARLLVEIAKVRSDRDALVVQAKEQAAKLLREAGVEAAVAV